MNDSEKRIFGPALSDVISAAKRANDILLKKLEAANKKNVDWLFDSVIESEAIGINDYWYLPGGHWKPKSCMPRWKVNGGRVKKQNNNIENNRVRKEHHTGNCDNTLNIHK